MKPTAASLGAMLLAACGGGRHTLTTRVDSAGVEIVSYGGPDVQLDWRFDSLFALGGADTGMQSFYQLRGGVVRADDAGSLYVLDESAKRIVVFDSAGRFVRAMGKAGGGPGEMQWPITLVVTPDGRAAALDIGKHGFVWFGTDGAALAQTPQLPGYMGAGIYATRDALVYRSRVWGNGAEEGGRNELVRIAEGDTVPLVSVPTPPGKSIRLQSCGMGLTGMMPIFTPEIRWAAAGERVAYATGASYEVTLAGPSPTRVVRRPLEPERATEQAALKEIDGGMRVTTPAGERVCRPEEVVQEVGYADRIPIIAEIAAGPDDTWVVRRRAGAGADVFAVDGEYVGTLPANAPFPLLVLPGSRIAAIAVDSLDVERLVVYRVDTAGH